MWLHREADLCSPQFAECLIDCIRWPAPRLLTTAVSTRAHHHQVDWRPAYNANRKRLPPGNPLIARRDHSVTPPQSDCATVGVSKDFDHAQIAYAGAAAFRDRRRSCLGGPVQICEPPVAGRAANDRDADVGISLATAAAEGAKNAKHQARAFKQREKP